MAWPIHRLGSCQTEDLKKVYEWTTQWSDLLEFTVVPVLEDPELGEVLSKLA